MIKHKGITVTDELTQSLKDKGAWEEFCEEVNRTDYSSRGETTLGAIHEAFQWDETSQGLAFWSDLSDEINEW